jgi:two-component system, cell cycle sensor histidine kinase and response regulator CckA
MPEVKNSTSRTSRRGAHPDLRTLLLAQKTEVLGELTSAIANQFNNIMMEITGYAELEMKKLPANKRRSLEQVLSSAARAADLVQRLLRISRNLPPVNQPLDINALLDGIRPLVEQIAGSKISIVYSLEPNVPRICCDSSQLEQVMLSFSINARNAMPEGGKITFTAKLVDLDRNSISENEKPGPYVMLAVEDTGSGSLSKTAHSANMGATDQDPRINLSIAAVKAVMKDAEGIFRFASDPAKGSTFRIYLPPLQAEASTVPKRVTPRNMPVARTILIVEDDDAVRIPTAELLMMEGLKVLQARTGEEAIHVVQQNRSAIDVLITDVVMPRMTGHEVAERLLEMNPELKVLFMSGEDISRRPENSKGACAALRKPFRLEVLKDKIHELLNE